MIGNTPTLSYLVPYINPTPWGGCAKLNNVCD